MCIVVLLVVVALPVSASSEDEGIAQAERTLLSFFASLSSRDYVAAVEFYGGSYGVLRSWNRDLDQSALPDLWKRGCEQGGLQCLAVRRVVAAAKLKAGKYRFEVEFSTADGELFVRRSAEEGDPAAAHPDSSFAYIVEDSGEGYLVQGLPPYIP
jgi:hypothetical protein